MIVVPLAQFPSQIVQVQLGGQRCTLGVYQKTCYDPAFYGPLLFMDVSVDDSLVIAGVPCLDRKLIVRNKYLGFTGDFCWFDNQGFDLPQWQDLGGRWFLAYLEAGIDVP